VVTLLTDRARHARMVEDLRRVKALLGAPGASGRAADAILDVVSAVAGRAPGAKSA